MSRGAHRSACPWPSWTFWPPTRCARDCSSPCTSANGLGEGAYIETWLDASGFSGLVNRGTEHLVAGRTPEPLGALHPQIAPYGELFTCRCGSVVVTAVGSDPQFRSLCSLLGQEELADDGRFATNPQRVTHRTALAGLLTPLFADIEVGPLLDQALSRGIPLGRVKSVSDALSSGTGRAMTAAYVVEGTRCATCARWHSGFTATATGPHSSGPAEWAVGLSATRDSGS